eukprot:CAMPEP_0175079972 /NCGR_PEP_ID=MMETSP0052_2-20121109/25198_1 /TAXON_ID=51329 ORGANISM="Polytomella parva, Strain SAG 63-3" /NCGR_SAMPLE_ID=MMETSP0052_2 /ASSEMBLY_ACC=CAM_ASM_000194 /LENGTH=392 /DNA_ID=CAMNT_0016350519 /DNA_START=302 /DNA_END=1480 /DNA_ORIENTATION=+
MVATVVSFILDRPVLESSQHPSPSSESSRFFVALDDLDALMELISPTSTLQILKLAKQSASISSIFAYVHSDLLSPDTRFALDSLSTCIAELSVVQPLELDLLRSLLVRAATSHVLCRVDMKFKRRSGLLKTETRYLSQLPAVEGGRGGRNGLGESREEDDTMVAKGEGERQREEEEKGEKAGKWEKEEELMIKIEVLMPPAEMATSLPSTTAAAAALLAAKASSSSLVSSLGAGAPGSARGSATTEGVSANTMGLTPLTSNISQSQMSSKDKALPLSTLTATYSPSSSSSAATITTPAAAVSATTPTLTAGGMRLGLQAKEKVVLPYQHTGEGRIYREAADFREYLPPAAGGHGAAAGGAGENRLGHIMYMRDSDSDGCDSDEDPDDDLDI